MPKTVEESLLGDHSDQWMDSDCPEAKRLKVSYTTSLHLYIVLINLHTHKHNSVYVIFSTAFQPAFKVSKKIELSHSVSSG